MVVDHALRELLRFANQQAAVVSNQPSIVAVFMFKIDFANLATAAEAVT